MGLELVTHLVGFRVQYILLAVVAKPSIECDYHDIRNFYSNLFLNFLHLRPCALHPGCPHQACSFTSTWLIFCQNHCLSGSCRRMRCSTCDGEKESKPSPGVPISSSLNIASTGSEDANAANQKQGKHDQTCSNPATKSTKF